MTAYYNENDPFMATWLRQLISANLIAPGDVDRRNIKDVTTGDVKGYTQAHFFAGIGWWSYALRLAGWPDSREAWTGSCPCQRLSSAARGRWVAEDLRSCWIRLIAEHAPRVVFGEQVVNEQWADALVRELESVGYEVGAAVVPACALGFDHARERFYFVGHTNRNSQSGLSVYEQVARMSRNNSDTRSMVPAHGVSGRMALLRGFGNAIIPQVAQAFIEAYLEATP